MFLPFNADEVLSQKFNDSTYDEKLIAAANFDGIVDDEGDAKIDGSDALALLKYTGGQENDDGEFVDSDEYLLTRMKTQLLAKWVFFNGDQEKSGERGFQKILLTTSQFLLVM